MNTVTNDTAGAAPVAPDADLGTDLSAAPLMGTLAAGVPVAAFAAPGSPAPTGGPLVGAAAALVALCAACGPASDATSEAGEAWYEAAPALSDLASDYGPAATFGAAVFGREVVPLTGPDRTDGGYCFEAFQVAAVFLAAARRGDTPAVEALRAVAAAVALRDPQTAAEVASALPAP